MPCATKELQRDYQRAWVAKRRKAWFSDKSCAVCKSKDYLELDHINPKNKVASCIWSWSEKRRDAELKKCQVLCRSCHIAYTVQDLVLVYGVKIAEHGTSSMYRRGCRCSDCKESHRVRAAKYRARQR